MRNNRSQFAVRFAAIGALALLCAGPISADISGARHVVETTFNTIYDELSPHLSHAAPIDDVVSELLRTELLPHLDVRKFSKLIIGKHWKSTSASQREKFVEILTEFLVRTTVKVIVSNRDLLLNAADGVTIADVQQGRTEDRAVVTVHLSRSGQADRVIAFRMLRDGGSWKLYDLVFEGVSFAVNYRTILNSEIGKHGIDEVAANLSEKLAF